MENFCGKILDEIYYCEEYIQKDLKKDIYNLINMQCKFYREIHNKYKEYNVKSFVYPQFFNQTNLKGFIEKYYMNDLEEFINSRRNIMK